jgi:carotenoid cleavage dioxygenase
MFDGLIRYDRQGPTRSYCFGEGRITAESVFCPRAGGREEGDGYMVSFVHDRVEGRSELAILDAAQIEAGPVCRLALPRRVPFGFHATWAPALAPAEAK